MCSQRRAASQGCVRGLAAWLVVAVGVSGGACGGVTDAEHGRAQPEGADAAALVEPPDTGATDMEDARLQPEGTDAAALVTLPDGGSGSLGECIPYDDRCPAGTYCQYVDGRTRCVEEGEVPRDEVCNESGRCQRGSICLYGSDIYGDSCQQPCHLTEGSCDISRHTCFVAVGDEGEELPFGVCRYVE